MSFWDLRRDSKSRKPPLLPLASLGLSRRNGKDVDGNSGNKSRRSNEPEYEEVGPPRRRSENPGQRPPSPPARRNCELCGSVEAAVRCDKCQCQAFCLACDEMYHRHPRRNAHLRKAIDSPVAAGSGVRPPLPPKSGGEQSQSTSPPQPPPRKNKRGGFFTSGSTAKRNQRLTGSLMCLDQIKDSQPDFQPSTGEAARTLMSNLKRMMGGRPLPPPPDRPKEPEVAAAAPSAERSTIARSKTAPILTNDENKPPTPDALPLSPRDMNAPLANRISAKGPISASVPPTPSSAHAQYPPLQPPKRNPQGGRTHTRKLSLQQPMLLSEDKRASMVETSPGCIQWEPEVPKQQVAPGGVRSQSVSDEQWAQMMASSRVVPSIPPYPPVSGPGPVEQAGFSTGRRGYSSFTSGNRGPSAGRSLVSSASVCDLSSTSQHQHQSIQPFSNVHPANSFQQLSMMGYGAGMPWTPCEVCQNAALLCQSSMKRTASNLSMNLSSVGSEPSSGYPPWPQFSHMHPHMAPPMYPGYYTGIPHPHMMPIPLAMQAAGMGYNVSIPDSMQSFAKVTSSPTPSRSSSSRRLHKSSKSKSFSATDFDGRRSCSRKKGSDEREDYSSSSDSDSVEQLEENRLTSSLAWQCDHCTFINSGGSRTCGMCSKTPGGRSSAQNILRKSERRRKERRRERKKTEEQDFSDYEDDDNIARSNMSFSTRESKKNYRNKVQTNNKQTSRSNHLLRRSSSPSLSESDEEMNKKNIEKQLQDLHISSRSHFDDVNNGATVRSRYRDRDRSMDKHSQKQEGKHERKNAY